MLNLFNIISWEAFLQLSRPDYIWAFSTGGLLPYCIFTIIIIFIIFYIVLRKFFIKQKFTPKNYLFTFLGSLLIYYLLWVLLLIFFAIAIGRISQYI